ncbi:MAG: ribosome maturation factor RimP [Longimicrobiales bacterium]
MEADALERELERRVEALGYELVELERAGSRARPILRLRIDRPDSRPGDGVTVDDCARVSRALEPLLDETALGEGRYVVEVSSPGIERPLVRPRDFERFAGRTVALKGYGPLADRARNLEGELLGIQGEGEAQRVRLRLADGEEIEIPRRAVARAHLVFRWDERRR